MKIIFKFLMTLIFLVFIVVAGAYFAGAQILAQGLEAALGVPVKVGRLHVGLDSSDLGVYDLQLKNPNGFDEKVLTEISEIYVRYNLSEILKKKLIIEEVSFGLDQVVVERNQAGEINLLKLKPLEDMLSGQKKQESKSSDGGEVKEETTSAPTTSDGVKTQTKSDPFQVQIDKVRFKLGSARYVDSGKAEKQVREFSLGKKTIELTDLTDPQVIVQQIVMKIMQRVGLNALAPNLDQFKSAFGAQASKSLAKVKEGLDGLMTKIKSSIDKNKE